MLDLFGATNKLWARIPIMGDAVPVSVDPDRGTLDLLLVSGKDRALVRIHVELVDNESDA